MLADMMNSLSSLSLDQLKHAVHLREQLESLEIELKAIFGGAASAPAAPALLPRRRGRPPGKRAANAEAGLVAPLPTAPAAAGRGRGGSRRISPEARARIIAGTKARWARFYAAKAAAKPAGAARSSASPKKGVMSRAERGRIGALARWAKFRKAKRLKA
jgi:hypothetical protein